VVTVWTAHQRPRPTVEVFRVDRSHEQAADNRRDGGDRGDDGGPASGGRGAINRAVEPTLDAGLLFHMRRVLLGRRVSYLSGLTTA
jgi:hypothetical protein